MQKIQMDGELLLTLENQEIDLAWEAVDELRRRLVSPVRRMAARHVVDQISSRIVDKANGQPVPSSLRLSGPQAGVTVRALGSMGASEHYPELLEQVKKDL